MFYGSSSATAKYFNNIGTRRRDVGVTLAQRVSPLAARLSEMFAHGFCHRNRREENHLRSHFENDDRILIVPL